MVFKHSISILMFVSLCFASCDKEVNWKGQPQIIDAAFAGTDRAWLVTIKGELIRTEDGGKNWHTMSANTIDGFAGVSFIDAQRGWAVNNHGEVWRSVDSGGTWNPIGKLEAKRSGDWHFNSAVKIGFVDELHGWIVETLSIWRTEDGGATWKEVFSTLLPEVEGQPTAASFLSAMRAWVSGTDGEVYATADGAETWQTRKIAGKDSSFTDVFFLKERSGWLAGYVGGQYGAKIYRTRDGGLTWHLLPTTDQTAYIHSIYFFNDEEGWAVGNSPTSDRKSSHGTLLQTTDGGESWQLLPIGENEAFFDRVHFSDAAHGWLFARDNVYRTEDGSKTWRAVLKLPAIKNSG